MPVNIIWLPSWYPNILGPFDGDFIQRHARAVSASAKLTVVFFKKDTEGIVTNDLKKNVSIQNNLQEIICYYRPVKTRLNLLNRLISFYTYQKVYKKILTELINENGRPDLVHVHVALAAAAPALWLKKKYKVPLLISEHWTGYLPSALYGISNLHIFQRKLMEQLFASAMVLTAVSKVLGDSIKKHFIAPDHVVVPNVVNTDIFYPAPGPAKSVYRFIHISTLSFQKNIDAIINAFEIIKHKGCSFELLIFGPPSETIKTLIVNADLAGNTWLKNEVPQPALAKYVQEADALILFSLYETFGCVVIEANACGVPAILSDLPVFKEFVSEGENGIFVPEITPESLAAILEKFIERKYTFDRLVIAEKTMQRFSYPVVAKQFTDIYENVLAKPN